MGGEEKEQDDSTGTDDLRRVPSTEAKAQGEISTQKKPDPDVSEPYVVGPLLSKVYKAEPGQCIGAHSKANDLEEEAEPGPCNSAHSKADHPMEKISATPLDQVNAPKPMTATTIEEVQSPKIEMVWTTPTTGKPKCTGCEDRIKGRVVHFRGLPFHVACGRNAEDDEQEWEFECRRRQRQQQIESRRRERT